MSAKVFQATSWLVALLFFCLVSGRIMAFQKVDRPAAWKKIEEALEQGLPKTALELIQPIIDSALAEKQFGEVAKAIAYRVRIDSSTGAGPHGHSLVAAIKALAKEIEKAPAETQPILHAIQADYFRTYFSENRWQFSQRTATSAPTGEDFTTWDLQRIFKQIESHYDRALLAEESLRTIPIGNFESVINLGTLPSSYRPTLFDFLAYQALEFYTLPEHGLTKAEDAWEIDASGSALGPMQDFLAWEPQTTDTQSIRLKAIRLYQKLIRIHQSDAEPSAWMDAELNRLQYCFEASVGEEKTERYIAALKSFASTHSKHPLSASARFRWAEQLQRQNKLIEAREIAQQAVNTFPESSGGKQCFNLIVEIEAKSLSAETEKVWNKPYAPIRIRYKNLTKAYFRLYPADWLALLKQSKTSPEFFAPGFRGPGMEPTLLPTNKPVANWSVDLKATTDFLEATHDVEPPAGLKPGFYVLYCSANADFSATDNVIAASPLWVSNLALIVNQNNSDGQVSGFLLDNQFGTPIAGASIRAFLIDYNNNQISEKKGTTDRDGRFAISAVNQSLLILAEHEGQSIASRDFAYASEPQPQQPEILQHVMFTDRALYRPGQTIHFKGICFRMDTFSNQYEALRNYPVTVNFLDRNGQMIETRSLKSNSFGSFSGTFTAPHNRGTGNMSITVNGMHSTAFQVEEYKRPKFEVKLEPPRESPKLDEEVTVVGKALSYTGMPIQGGKVSFHVIREVHWPIWFRTCFPWRIPSWGEPQEIAHGNVKTEPNGSFEFKFVAKPDRSINERDNPIFRYSIVASVTDSTGETRMGSSSVSAGYVAMQVTMASDDWKTASQPVKIQIDTTSLDGQPTASQGTVKIFTLKQPQEVIRPELLGQRIHGLNRPRNLRPSGSVEDSESPFDPASPNSWETDELIDTKSFETKADGKIEVSYKLDRGIYRAIVESQDRFGKPVTSILNFDVIDDTKFDLGLKLPSKLVSPSWKLEPGETFKAIWGTGYDKGQAYVEVVMGKKVLQSYWTRPDITQSVIEQHITEEMRGGLTLRVLFVRENRSYIEQRNIQVPWSNKELTIKTERLVSKLEPGVKEKIKLVVSGPKSSTVVAELVAGMYDVSLDAYQPHVWMKRFEGFRQNYSWAGWAFSNLGWQLNPLVSSFHLPYQSHDVSYPKLGDQIKIPMLHLMLRSRMSEARFDTMSAVPSAAGVGGMPANEMYSGVEPGVQIKAAAPEGEAIPKVKIESVSARKNLRETAFFFPHVEAKPDGSFELEFTIPEALTTWRFMAFAHDIELKSGYLEDRVVTSKDIMVQPNPPRFFREGDQIEFSVKVSNSSREPQSGRVALKLFDVTGERSLDASFENRDIEKSFRLEGGESKSFYWKLNVPDGSMPIVYKALGGTERTTDGEEGVLPVLSKRILVTESMPLPMRGKQTRTFAFQKLIESSKSDTLKHESLTLQMVSQPAWYAVLALPYLMEYPYECSEQTFNRMYANLLAQHIANSHPKIRRIFETWTNLQPEALNSPLQKNQDLKSVMLEETPWLRESIAESQARRDVALLFDENRLSAEIARSSIQLLEMQRANGMWPWFTGGPDNQYLTLYIMTGYGRLRQLGVPIEMSPAVKTLAGLDAWMDSLYRDILKVAKDPESNHLSSTICLYLYGRSFFLRDMPIGPQHQVAIQYWRRQAQQYWLSQSRQNQAQLAIGLHRMGDELVPTKIINSMREFAKSSDEMGMYWSDESSWWWYHAPIETQATIIEMFDEVAKDRKTVDDCKVWLLKQKQTQAWKTTKSTADAIYALLLRGDNWLSSDALIEVQLAGQAIRPDKVEAGTGFFEQKFFKSEIKPEFGKIQVVKSDAGVSWGSMHWQYLEDINKVLPHDGTPLRLEKQIFRKIQTKAGAELQAINGPVQVGDELVSRIVLRADRDMEFVHLKDYRGSGTEPVNVLSGYRYQDGLGYYESTRDAASHFFIDYLRKGNYVFEYSLRVQHAGKYPSGMASVQCMYAPEFNSHSASVDLEVSADR